jgi:hypothetical protein
MNPPKSADWVATTTNWPKTRRLTDAEIAERRQRAQRRAIRAKRATYLREVWFKERGL